MTGSERPLSGRLAEVLSIHCMRGSRGIHVGWGSWRVFIVEQVGGDSAADELRAREQIDNGVLKQRYRSNQKRQNKREWCGRRRGIEYNKAES